MCSLLSVSSDRIIVLLLTHRYMSAAVMVTWCMVGLPVHNIVCHPIEIAHLSTIFDKTSVQKLVDVLLCLELELLAVFLKRQAYVCPYTVLSVFVCRSSVFCEECIALCVVIFKESGQLALHRVVSYQRCSYKR